MHLRRTLSTALIFSALAAAPALAQSNIKPANKYCWGENVGYINMRDSGATIGAQGVRINGSYLSGYAWGENIGYISFGSAPANNVSYANPTGGSVPGVPDYGVNRDPATGNLSGFAWGENVGWINFSGGALASPAQPARFDAPAKRLRGYAWGENIGWINLDDSTLLVAVCVADFNSDGAVTVSDIFAFLGAWFAHSPQANINGNATVDVADIFAYLGAWFVGC